MPLKELKIKLFKFIFNPDNYKIILKENLIFFNDFSHIFSLYVTVKKRDSFNLTFRFRADKKIVTLSKLFKTFDMKKLNALFAESIFQPEMYDEKIYRNVIIFKLRIVPKVKNKNTFFLYEKFRLVV